MQETIRHRSNDITSGLLHLAGLVAAIASLVVLIILSSIKSDAWSLVGYIIYGVGLIVLYFTSMSYHLLPPTWPRIKRLAQKFDHAMIFVLIAATYTPITFIVLDGGWRWSIFGVVWGLGIIGITLKFAVAEMPGYVNIFLYVVMGWLILIALKPLLANLDIKTFVFLLGGGIAYSVGIVFFALESVFEQRRYFWMHEIFHVFTLIGSMMHTIVMFRLLP